MIEPGAEKRHQFHAGTVPEIGGIAVCAPCSGNAADITSNAREKDNQHALAMRRGHEPGKENLHV
jgi:hypothetical protein